MSNNNDTILKKVITGIAISLGGVAITEAFKLIRSTTMSIINIAEWDNSYNNINKLIYTLDENNYNKHRTPTTNKVWFELTCGTSYFIKLKDNNYL